MAERTLQVVRLGRLDYLDADAVQSQRRDQVLAGEAADTLFLLEHSPVFTLGRNASGRDVLASSEWLAQRGIETLSSDRGGQVTYHGPGQLVGYPVMNLKPDRRDVRRYVRDLQDVLVRTLAHWQIPARGGEGETIGVWTEDEPGRKIASIGIHLKRWVTTHGFALNVSTDLDHFQGIIACGLDQVAMTSMENLLGSSVPSLDQVADVLVVEFARVFETLVVEVEHTALSSSETTSVRLTR